MHRLVHRLSQALAWFGAVVLVAIAVLSVVSISGRALAFAGLGPIPGDFELVEAATALAVFCFLPWCHLAGGHANVDMFWNLYPVPLRRALALFADLLMFGVWTLLVWRMAIATLEYRANGETTFILQMPVWWGYAASLLPAIFGCVVYAWRVLESAGLVRTPEVPAAAEGSH